MENASKALLIAGSILIVILLIAMGMRVFNSTSGTADATETTMKATEIATFNSKFTQYAGSYKSAAQVKALANVVIAHNATDSRKVNFQGSYDASSITVTASGFTGSSYRIIVHIDSNTGLVDYIRIGN